MVEWLSYKLKSRRHVIVFPFLVTIFAIVLSGCIKIGQKQNLEHTTEPPSVQTPNLTSTLALSPTPYSTSAPGFPDSINAASISSPTPTQTPLQPPVQGASRGYMTTPQELAHIKERADQGIEPYRSAVEAVLKWANRQWDYKLEAHETCQNSDKPAWIDNQKGIPILYAKALAYHLTGDSKYAQEVSDILQRIMTEVKTISIEVGQCRLNFGWGTPELVASADLIEEFWNSQRCSGPVSTLYKDAEIGSGECKVLFQNWLVKNPYFVVSYSAVTSQSNWGAATTTATAYIADYLWDRPEVMLVHRYPQELSDGKNVSRSPAEAYVYANQLTIDRMNGYGVEYGSSSSCDYLSGSQQSDQWEPVKSQITENGIIPEDARREEHCNIPQYNGDYQNYPQIHLGNTIQQCELMLRRGDRSCYDNIENSDIPDYTFIGPDGETKTTHLYPGRGSIERAIKSIIVDSSTEWRHDSALEVAYRYYFKHHTLPGFEEWFKEINGRPQGCAQDICFGTLTHGFDLDVDPILPSMVPPPIP